MNTAEELQSIIDSLQENAALTDAYVIKLLAENEELRARLDAAQPASAEPDGYIYSFHGFLDSVHKSLSSDVWNAQKPFKTEPYYLAPQPAQADAQDARQWQPSATAPKDRTVIWVYADDEQLAAKWISGDRYALWSYADKLLADIYPEGPNPSHWMPLPPPPAMEKP